MIRNLFLAALIAAFGAGAVYSLVQQWRVSPLIIAAEAYEGAPVEEHSHEVPPGAAAAAAVPAQEAQEHAHEHGEDEWAPQDGFERTAYTIAANFLAAAGFALILGAVSMFAGIPITFANGLLWGLGGFAAFQLAPSFGLAPELPGMPAADLGARQVWWIGTVLATGAALLLVAKFRAGWALGAAVVLIALPHVIGTPAAPEEASAVPAHLATEFAAATIGSGVVLWLLLGLGFGYVNDRLAARQPAAAQGALA